MKTSIQNDMENKGKSNSNLESLKPKSKESEVNLNLNVPKDYDISAIIKNFKMNKDLADNHLKELKQNFIESNSGSGSVENTNLNILSNQTNNIGTYVGNSQSVKISEQFNSDGKNNIGNLSSNVDFNELIYQLTKENTSLKIELKILYDNLKQASLITEYNREELEKLGYNVSKNEGKRVINSNTNSGNYNIKESPDVLVKKNTMSYVSELNLNGNLNNVDKQIQFQNQNTNYLIKIQDEGKKDSFFIDIKKYIRNLRFSEFFI